MTETPVAAPPRAAPVDPALHADRRDRMLRAVGDAVVILPAAEPQIRSRDSEYRYRPDSDLYYLTGVREPEAIAVLTPFDDAHRFTLFVRPRDPDAERWDGGRLGVDGAREACGADAAYPVAEFADRLPELLGPADRIAYALGEHPSIDPVVVDCLRTFRMKRPRSGRGPAGVVDPGLWLHAMRRRKDAAEIERLRAACQLTARAHRAAMASVRPGRGEWEIEAVLEHAFRSGGGEGAAFASIVAGGANATVLHYVENADVLREGDLVLIDAGVDLGMYCGDVTRTLPVSGRFTEAQREVYDIVLEALRAAVSAVAPGAPADAPHRAAAETLCAGLVELGVLDGPVDECMEEEAYKPYFMHRTSHWLGLDVHDVGDYSTGDAPVTLEEGMVLTVEPGLYFPDEDSVPERYRGIGVRLEDDVAVGADGPEVLTGDAPLDPDEVEALAGSA